MDWKINRTKLPGLLLLEPPLHEDARGSLCEIFHQEQLKRFGIQATFVQENESISRQGVLRGLHAQSRRPQAKLIRVVVGEIYDVAVDARPGSPAYGQWQAFTLSAQNRFQIFLPEGFLHGFYTARGPATVQYRCSEYYDPSDQVGVRWDDPDLGIAWAEPQPILSEKDARNPSWSVQKALWERWNHYCHS
jgi:dTDP-4-dehydrorhamnose 3,5-epimerase